MYKNKKTGASVKVVFDILNFPLTNLIEQSWYKIQYFTVKTEDNSIDKHTVTATYNMKEYKQH